MNQCTFHSTGGIGIPASRRDDAGMSVIAGIISEETPFLCRRGRRTSLLELNPDKMNMLWTVKSANLDGGTQLVVDGIALYLKVQVREFGL